MKKYSLFLLMPLVWISCSDAPKKAVRESAADSLTAEIQKIADERIFNGFAVAVVSEKGILYEKGFGYADVAAQTKYTEHTIQNIASVSKTLVGISLLKAQELGKLNLDDPIEKYLPFRVVNPRFPNEKITIRQLATHTSSIMDNEYYLSKNYILKPGQKLEGAKLRFDDEQVFNPPDSAVTLETFLENTLTPGGKWSAGSFTEHKPGAMYEYSNTGTALAAFIVERATGMAFDVFTETHILRPLKMEASGWSFADVDFSRYSKLYATPDSVLPHYRLITYPDGGFITSVHDLGTFLAELIRGQLGKGSLLSEAGYNEYFRPQLAAENFLERSENNPYNDSYNTGIFIGFGYTGYIGHTGGDPGVVSMLFFDPESGLGRIMVFNTNFSDKKGNDAFYNIWNLLEKYQARL